MWKEATGRHWIRLAAQDSRVSLWCRSTGAGLGEALNRGVALAQGGLIARVDTGDVHRAGAAVSASGAAPGGG